MGFAIYPWHSAPQPIWRRHANTAPSVWSGRTTNAGVANPDVSMFFERRHHRTTLHSAPIDGALSTGDLVSGVVLALLLAFLASLLQGQRQASSNLAPWPKKEESTTSLSANNSNSTSKAFETDDWKEISRPENYVYYNTRVRQKKQQQNAPSSSPLVRTEQVWVVVALLLLFVPIFSAELALAVSRQVLCGPLLDFSDFAKELCGPHFVDLAPVTLRTNDLDSIWIRPTVLRYV